MVKELNITTYYDQGKALSANARYEKNATGALTRNLEAVLVLAKLRDVTPLAV